MSVNWKICNECGRKVNEVAIECPYCSSNSFKKYIDDSDVSSENDEIPKKENKNNENEPFNKIKEGFDNFSNNTKKMGNDFLHENLPEDYADKVTENLSNISNSFNLTNICDSVNEMIEYEYLKYNHNEFDSFSDYKNKLNEYLEEIKEVKQDKIYNKKRRLQSSRLFLFHFKLRHHFLFLLRFQQRLSHRLQRSG